MSGSYHANFPTVPFAIFAESSRLGLTPTKKDNRKRQPILALCINVKKFAQTAAMS